MCQRPNAVGDVREASGHQKRVERIGFRLQVYRKVISASILLLRAPSPSEVFCQDP